MYWKHGLALMAAALLTLSAGATRAQEEREGAQQPQRPNQQRERAGQQEGAQQFGQRPGAQREGRMAQQVDQHVAFMLALGNKAEVELGQLASQRSQNPQVKEFAQKMVQEHTQFLQQLQTHLPPGQWEWLQASSAGVGRAGAQEREGAAVRTDDQPAVGRQAGQERPGRQGRPGAGAQGQQPGGPMMQMEKDAAQRIIQRTKEYLNEKQGREFDQTYLGQQIVAHIHMLGKLEAAQEHVSSDLQQILRQGAQSTEQHLKEAQTLAQAIERGGQQGIQPGLPGRPGVQPGRPGVQPDQPGLPGRPQPPQPGQP